MTAARFNGAAHPNLKEEAERLRNRFRQSNGLHPGLDEFIVEGAHYLRYPDGIFRDERGQKEFDPRNLLRPDPDDIGETRATVQYQGRAYLREVDGSWRDEYGRTLHRTDNNGWTVDSPQRLWKTERLTKWFDQIIPARRWFMEDWLPLGQCTGLYGIPGVRKSLWILQAMIAGALGKAHCGIPIEASPVLGLFCEDTDEEIARRAAKILHYYRHSFAELGNLNYTSLVGADFTEFVTFTVAGTMILTPAYTTFREQLFDIKPKLAALDVGPDFFAGNENDRSQVGRFIRLLDRLASEVDCALLFSAHPSRRGMAQGALDSGSTGWEGKVRARLALHDPAADDDDDDGDDEKARLARMLAIARNPSDERILTRAKSNYAAPGEEIPLVLRDGAFDPKNIDPETAPKRGPMREREADAKFLELMTKVKAAGGYVNDSPSVPARYAPKVFISHPDHGDVTKHEFEKAMARLMGTSRIRLQQVGKGRHTHMELSIC